ncbi:MAG: zinc-ribbon domain-containing protein [Coriobacteriaceae bacterium]|nr:zinc-ribbon domain-containing protein [Coriobacteriaceae bacterium]
MGYVWQTLHVKVGLLMFCPECGSEVPEGKKFCGNCGTALPQPQPQQAQPQQPQQDQGQGYAAYQKRTPQPHYSSQGQAGAGTAQGQPKPGQPGQPKKGGKAPIVIGIVIVVFIALIAGIVALGSSVLGSLGEVGSGGSSSTLGPKPAISESDAAKSGDTWTVLFYCCGSNLESEAGLATIDFQEMFDADLGDKVTVVAEAGGTKRWNNKQFSPKYLNRAVFQGDDFEVVEQLPAASMAEPDTLADFIKWGTKNYPADHYMVILWNHGSGAVLGVCNDELFPGTSMMGDTLTVSEIESAFKEAGATFDVLGFDTCLMATLETATKLAPYADYMIASEEVEPGSGWDYEAWLTWLAGHTGTDGNLLGREICDSYYDKCVVDGVSEMATMSVIDLSQMDALAEAFFEASKEFALATVSVDDLRSLTQGAYKTSRFGSDVAYNMVDLGDLMRNTSSVVSEHADDVTAALENAVVYQVHGPNRPNVTGLSVFYPLDTSYDEFFYEYLNVVGNVPYAQFLAVMYNKYDSVNWSDYSSAVDLGEKPVEEKDISIKYSEKVNSDGQLELHITDGLDDLAHVHIELAIYLPDKNAIVYLGTDHNVNNPQSGVYSDNFYGEWMAIDGNYVCANLVEHGDGYNIYSIPVNLNGESTNLVATYDFSTKKYEILFASDDIEEYGTAATNMRELKDGDKIEFLFGAYLFDTGESFSFTMGSTTYSKSSTTMEDLDLGEGAYLYQFVLTDVLGEEHDTEFYVQHYKADGSITVESLDDYFK